MNNTKKSQPMQEKLKTGVLSQKIDGPTCVRKDDYSNKILTIIIPTYNMEKYLRHCLDSLIVPNMDKVEVLVINDGSKDSSSAIGHEYQDKYPQTFRVIDKENGNYGSCVNRGLKEAQGKYIKILDADDSYYPDGLKMFIEQLDSCDSDLILSDFTVVNENGKLVERFLCSKQYGISPNKEYLVDNVLKTLPSFVGTMDAFTYKLSIFDGWDYHQKEGISYTDQQWILEPFTHVKTIRYIPIYVYVYLRGRVGQTMENVGKHIDDLMKMVKELILFYEGTTWKHDLYSPYLAKVIKGQLGIIYDLCLFQHKYDIEKLVEFDTWLNDFREIELMALDINTCGLYFVKEWKERGRQSLPKTMIVKKKAKDMYKSVKHILRSLLPY